MVDALCPPGISKFKLSSARFGKTIAGRVVLAETGDMI